MRTTHLVARGELDIAQHGAAAQRKPGAALGHALAVQGDVGVGVEVGRELRRPEHGHGEAVFVEADPLGRGGALSVYRFIKENGTMCGRMG